MSVIDFLDKHTWIPNIITIVVTIFIAVMQIGKQFKNTLASQRSSKLDEFHLKIYNEIADSIKSYGDSLAKLSGFVTSLPSNIKNKIIFVQEANTIGMTGITYSLTERYEHFAKLNIDTMTCYGSVLAVIDKYEIAFNNFGTIRLEIDKTYNKLLKTCMEFGFVIEKYLPIDIEKEHQDILGGKTLPLKIPDEVTLENIKSMSKITDDLIMDMICYVHDLRVEAQNELLSPIFESKKALPRRPPGPDDNYKVLTTDK
jgi:hypothetical protein